MRSDYWTYPRGGVRAWRLEVDGTGRFVTLRDSKEQEHDYPGTLPYRKAIRTELDVEYIDPIKFPLPTRRGRIWTMWVDDEFNFKDLPVNPVADKLLHRFGASQATHGRRWQVHGTVLITGNTHLGDRRRRPHPITSLTEADLTRIGLGDP